MGILTQKDVDNLIRTLVEGSQEAEPGEKAHLAKQARLRVYDFRTPNKFTREDLRTLYTIHQSFASLLALELSARARIPTNVEVLSVEQGMSDRILDSIPNPGFVGIITVEPPEDVILLEIEAGFVLATVQRLMGGLPSSCEQPRELTEIEQQVALLLLEDFLNAMRSVWSKTFSVHLGLQSTQTNPAFIATSLRGIPVAVIALSITYGAHMAYARLVLPHRTLEPLLSKTTRPTDRNVSNRERYLRTWSFSSIATSGERTFADDRTQKEAQHRDQLIRAIAESCVPVTVEIGEIAATLGECRGLSPGDVVMIPRRIDSPVTIKVQGRPKFRGFLGRSGHHLAVIVTDCLEPTSSPTNTTGSGKPETDAPSLTDFFIETKRMLGYRGPAK
ncbi:MAG TPA: flagellar motor switch protein FliM [Clostridia bacterium]|nr:flagellar motor switch protein FliM [Clostridia bacterium]